MLQGWQRAEPQLHAALMGTHNLGDVVAIGFGLADFLIAVEEFLVGYELLRHRQRIRTAASDWWQCMARRLRVLSKLLLQVVEAWPCTAVLAEQSGQSQGSARLQSMMQ